MRSIAKGFVMQSIAKAVLYLLKYKTDLIFNSS